MLTINYKDPRPIYEQVRDALGQLILSGAMVPGEKLPSVRELAGTLAINPNTIQRAYRELEALGMIYTVAGKGAFAADRSGAVARRKQELTENLTRTLREFRRLGTEQAELEELLRAVYGEEAES